jgi:hypothetical protein
MGGPNFLGLGQLRIDSSSSSYFLNGNVGIGTSTPGFRLEVNNSSAGQTRNLLKLVGGQATRNPRLNVTSNNTESGTMYLMLQTDSDAGEFPHLALVPSGGYLGVGTTNPGSILTVMGDNLSGSDRVDQVMGRGKTNSNLKLNIGIRTEVSPAYAEIGFVERPSHGENTVIAKQSSSNVGIGTANPQ